MKFSIITVVRNAEKTIRATIDSVINQIYSDFEYLIIDGKSTDGTVGLLRYYSLLDSRIRYISETDHGIYDAMNKGIRLSKGEWCYFLGADDCLYNDQVLSFVASFITNTPSANVCYGDVIFTSSNLRYDGEYSLSKFCNHAICHQAIFYKREIFDRYGMYDLKYKINADHVFNIRVFTTMFDQVVYFPFVVCLYNNETGVSSNVIDIELRNDNFQIRYDAFRDLLPKISLARIFFSSFIYYYKSHSWKDVGKYLTLVKKDIGIGCLVYYFFVILKMRLCRTEEV
ncbi:MULTISPECIES: glycosyltransferase family 2 protein [unclassified Bacteroides]|uniref:glycosyltransferase family 2 protein n=1 Tax=unclassified Bacteroides TaxID=2646097 RepID=UPI0013EA5239|nr:MULTISPECIES: glycosyltransferase family 2 protein [unclassified Bacteroides]QTO24473.1 glycosyltransferase [Bacteroides sp. ZJ-18]